MNGLLMLILYLKEKKIRELGHDVEQILFENIDLDLVKRIESRNSDFYISQSGIGSDIRIFLYGGGKKFLGAF